MGTTNSAPARLMSGTLALVQTSTGLVRVPATAWAGPGYTSREPVREQERAAWACLECTCAGSAGNAIPPEQEAHRHADESRHVVQVTRTTTYIPGER